MSTIAVNFENKFSAVADSRNGFIGKSGPFEEERLGWKSRSLVVNRLEPLETLVVGKLQPGFDPDSIDDLRRLLSAISRGEITRLKYLVFDFQHSTDGYSAGAEGFDALVVASAELILRAPVITLAWVRSPMAGADLEFATQCSMLVAEKNARFSFDGEPAELYGLYSVLARKIGFVRAQRLIEQGAVLRAEEMRDLFLAKDVVEPQNGAAGIGRFIRQYGRRYNAAYSIFRAQRSVMKSIGLRPDVRARV